MMNALNYVRGAALLSTTMILVGCSAGGLPSDLNSTSSVSNAVTTPQYLPVVLTAPKYSLTQGDTVQLSASGGLAPYTYQGGSVSSAGVFTASTVGSFHVIVSDSQTPAQTAFVDLVVAAKPADTTTTTTTPTTTPTVVTPPPVQIPALRIVYRMFNNIHGLHQVSLTDGASGLGWGAEGEQYRLYVSQIAGMHAIYFCKLPNPLADGYFESTDPNCEGYPQVGVLGYAWDNPQAGMTALNRYERTYPYAYGLLSDHIDLKTDVGSTSGYGKEYTLGYVPN